MNKKVYVIIERWHDNGSMFPCDAEFHEHVNSIFDSLESINEGFEKLCLNGEETVESNCIDYLSYTIAEWDMNKLDMPYNEYSELKTTAFGDLTLGDNIFK